MTDDFSYLDLFPRTCGAAAEAVIRSASGRGKGQSDRGHLKFKESEL